MKISERYKKLNSTNKFFLVISVLLPLIIMTVLSVFFTEFALILVSVIGIFVAVYGSVWSFVFLYFFFTGKL